VYHLATASPSGLASDIGAAHRTYSGGDLADAIARSHHLATANVRARALGSTQRPPARTANQASPAKNPKSPKPANTKPTASSSPRQATTSPAPSPSPSPSSTVTGPSCSGEGGMLPANYATIVTFLTAHGYTGLAAAGITGNIYQESKGNPESVGTGGGGLIGWTPLPSGFVTGNPAADLQTQLEALLTYNDQWSQYIPALNAATNATDAAYIYMTDFERPGIPAAYNREGAADAVAAACHL
jgi:hypothetical protein